MATEGTLADPPCVPSCAICGADDCVHFQEAPYPEDYPFLPGGYDKRASNDVQPRAQRGARKTKGMKWRS